MSLQQLTAALNLTRRLPPYDIEKNVVGLVHLSPQLGEEILQRIDRPLKLMLDEEAHLFFVMSDYNRHNDSFRSPWTSRYYPPLSVEEAAEAYFPGECLRHLEQMYNEMFDAYRQKFFGGGVSSVYLWLTPHEGLALAVFIHKELELSEASESSAVWDSVHIVEVVEQGSQMQYKLTSTVFFLISSERNELDKGDMDAEDMKARLSGQITRQSEEIQKCSSSADAKYSHNHILQIGPMVEHAETRLRKDIEQLYLHKLQDVAGGLRKLETDEDGKRIDGGDSDDALLAQVDSVAAKINPFQAELAAVLKNKRKD